MGGDQPPSLNLRGRSSATGAKELMQGVQSSFRDASKEGVLLLFGRAAGRSEGADVGDRTRRLLPLTAASKEKTGSQFSSLLRTIL